MSRKGSTTMTINRSTSNPSNAIPTDICPVCKRVRYLNAEMKFLINPECYHPMCSNCVNTIFKSGPAQCPYASCNKTLRFRGFRDAFFADLGVEREVDIRKRVAAVFNNAQDDFETLRDYNDYLQKVEDLTFDLVNGSEEERTRAEEELERWESQHKLDIERNKKKGSDMERSRKKREADAKAAAEARRLEELKEEERIKSEEASVNRKVMDALERGEPGSAAEIRDRILARERVRLAQLKSSHLALDQPPSPILSIRGLKQKHLIKDEDANKPYSPFAGLHLEPARYSLHDSYENPFLDAARTKDDHRVPGYDVQEYVARAMFEAFAGLGVMVDEEKAAEQKVVGTVGARDAAQTEGTVEPLATGSRMEVDDVFS